MACFFCRTQRERSDSVLDMSFEPYTAAISALEREACTCATERLLVDIVIAQKKDAGECWEAERLAHNKLLQQEPGADRDRMGFIVRVGRESRRDIKYN